MLAELKVVFSPSQNLPQVQTDLARVKQNPQEKVAEYGLRVKKILQKAQELISENFTPLISRSMIEETVNTAVECFTLGLNSEIAMQMIGKNSPNLEAAINTAMVCERHVQQRKELHGEKIDESRKRAYCHISEPQDELAPGNKKCKCYPCGVQGHIARNCQRRFPSNNMQQPHYSNPNPLNFNIVGRPGVTTNQLNPNYPAPKP